jgi:hypothetical protein
MRYLKVTLLLLMLVLTLLAGCTSRLVLHPITDQDFAVIKKGTPSPVDGYVMSDYYLKQVIQAKLEVK